MHQIKIIFLITLISLFTVSSWSTDWTAAPALESQQVSSTLDFPFIAIDSDTDLTDLLVEEEGWFWLRTVVNASKTDMVLIEGPRLGWEAWWNGGQFAESGSGPPLWRPSSPLPHLLPVPKASPRDNVLVIKTYVREGFDSQPGYVLTGNEKTLKRFQLIRAAEDLFLPGLMVLLGIILFIGRLIRFSSNHSFRDLSHSLFGLAMALLSMEPVLAFFPTVSVFIPWFAVAVLIKAVLPFAISLWRRSISNSGGKGSTIIGVFDLIIATFLTAWTAVVMIDFTLLPPPLDAWTGIDFLTWYIGISLTFAALSWIGGLIRKKPGRIEALLILLAGISPAAVFFVLGSSLSEAAGRFIEYGLPLSLLLCFLFGTDRTVKKEEETRDDASTLEPDIAQNNDCDEYMKIEELGFFDDSQKDAKIEEPEPIRPIVTVPSSVSTDMEDENPLIKGLRAHLYPDAFPWDSSWDLASTRRGSQYPATGFYDVYTEEGSLDGFSFMDTGTSELNAMMYAQVVRSEILRRFSSSHSLASLARTINRKTLELAVASGKRMAGVIGSFDKNGIRFLPLSLPPLLLKKSEENKIITLQPAMGRASNAPMGIKNFGDEGLRTLRISMQSQDALVMYSPTLVDVRSPSNEPWGIQRLAAALKSSDSMKADGIVEDIIESLKDYTGTETIGVPLQILIIKKR